MVRKYLEGLGVEFRFGVRCARVNRDSNIGDACGVMFVDGVVVVVKVVVFVVGYLFRGFMEVLYEEDVKLMY